MKRIIVIAHDMRSTHNIGSLFRTAEGLGVEKIYLTGYTAYPKLKEDKRLPHLSEKLTRQIEKTALGATKSIDWEKKEDVFEILEKLKINGYEIVALEQTENSMKLNKYQPKGKVALVLGTEVTGLPAEILNQTNTCLEIPMFGKKESFNVVQAAAMALYQFRFH